MQRTLFSHQLNPKFTLKLTDEEELAKTMELILSIELSKVK